MMEYEEMVFELAVRDGLYGDVGRLHSLASVAGLKVGLAVNDGRYFLSIRYSEEVTEHKRNRNAGRPRKKRRALLTCGEVVALKEAEGAKIAATTLGMPIATFYRRYKENKGKREEEPFV